MRKLTKISAVIGGGALVIATAGAAYAYWTTTGSGTGSATTKASNGVIVLHASFASNALAPGLSTPVSFTADNGGASNLYVGTVHSVVSTSDALCLPADFTIADVVENQVIAAGASGAALTNGGSISFANSGVSQDACKSATITLTLSSN